MNNKYTTLWTKDFIFLFLTSFFMFLGFQFLLPTLPLFALEKLGANPAHIGYLISAYAVAALIARPYAGYAYDYLGRKKTYLVSMALFTLLTFIYPYVGTFLIFLLLRFIHGLSFGVSSTGAATILADIIPPARRGEGIGLFGLTNTISMALGPAIGLWILKVSDYPQLFFSAGFFIFIAFVISMFISYPAQTAAKQKISLNMLFEKRIFSVAILVMFSSSLFAGLVAFITVFGKEINVDNVGLFFILNSLGVIITRIFAGRIHDTSGPKPIIIFGYINLIIGFVVLSISKDATLLYTSAVLIGLGNGLIMPALQAMVIDMVEPDRRGVATSTHFMALDLGIAGGSVILGWIAELTSISTMFLVCAIYLIIPFAIFYFYTLKDYQTKVAALKDVTEEISYSGLSQ